MGPLSLQMKIFYMSKTTAQVTLHHSVLDLGMPFLMKPFTTQGIADADSFSAHALGAPHKRQPIAPLARVTESGKLF